MRILLTNDDGIRAPGLLALLDVAREHGEVKVAAPEREKSGCGHGMTLHDPLRARAFEGLGVEAYEVNGLPVDCVNVGLTLAWPDGCDLVISGFNNGPNLGFDVTYSGTAAGAMEGTINGIRSLAFSMASFVSGAPLHYPTGATWLSEHWDLLVSAPMEPLTFLNVNIPAIDFLELKGHRVATMGKRVYEDRVEVRHDPWNKPYYWQGGVVVMNPDEEGTDVHAVANGFVSITPITLDWTAHAQMKSLERALERRARA